MAVRICCSMEKTVLASPQFSWGSDASLRSLVTISPNTRIVLQIRRVNPMCGFTSRAPMQPMSFMTTMYGGMTRMLILVIPPYIVVIKDIGCIGALDVKPHMG